MANILIADDDFTIKLELEEMLAELGHNVVGCAETGIQAFEMAEEMKPDLILMDVVMPGEMDGIIAAENIRREMDIPIVFISGYGDPEHIERAKRVEPWGYIVKPFDEREIKAVIEIGLYRKALESKFKISHQLLEQANIDLQREIEARKRIERALKENERKYRSLFENAPVGIGMADEKGNILYFNDAMLRPGGYNEGDIAEIGNIGQLYYDKDVRNRVLKRAARQGFVDEEPVRFKRKDGTPYDGLLSLRPIEIEGKNCWQAMVQDVTDRKQTEIALQESNRKFQTLFNECPHATAVAEIRTGRLLDVNHKFCELAGYRKHEVIGKTTVDLGFHSETNRSWLIDYMRAREGTVNGLETKFVTRSGSEIVGKIYIRIIGISGIPHLLVMFLDITEQKRLETLVLHAQKMEAIGTLAGGIAHDYNNLLAVVMGNLSVAMEAAEKGSHQADCLCDAETASRKIRDLTYELMALSNGGIPMRKFGEVEELIEGALKLARFEEKVFLKKEISPDLPKVLYDPVKMGIVVRNVLTNAVEAMPNGGTVEIGAKDLRISNRGDDVGQPIKPGDYVEISIKDQGVGISEENLGKIFDPYFSTKPMGVQKGMGLGMATSHAIVEKHGGYITIDSSFNSGTVVHIYLPAGKGLNQYEITAPEDHLEPVKKRVLLMDDEEMLLKMTRNMLEQMGYIVETVQGGDEAVTVFERWKNSGEPFDAVILDLTIKGGMGGEQTIKRLLKIDPDIKGIVSSGYFNDPVVANFEKYGFKGAMPKPFQKDHLEEALRKLFK